MGTMVPETCCVIGLPINHNCCIKLVNKSFHIKDARSHKHQILIRSINVQNTQKEHHPEDGRITGRNMLVKILKIQIRHYN